MSKLLILVTILLSEARAEIFEKTINTAGFFESNIYYEDKSDKGDFLVSLRPELFYDQQKMKGFNFLSSLEGSYSKYFSHSNLDYFDYKGNLKLSYITASDSVYYIQPLIDKKSEPPLNENAERLERQKMGGGAGFQWRWSDLSYFNISADYITDTNNNVGYDFQQNYEINGSVSHTYSFLPETNLVTTLKVGQKIFPNGKKNVGTSFEELAKFNSQYLELGSGVVGRLTRTMKIKSYAGFLIREYEKSTGSSLSSSFREPIFILEFEEERSPRDMILLGYDYVVEDTYYSNFVLKQKMHIGFGRIFGDQLLALARLIYQYRSYSLPARREDQRVAGEFKLDYSFSQTLKGEALFNFDLLTSESLGVSRNPSDPSVSYEYIRAGLNLKYLF